MNINGMVSGIIIGGGYEQDGAPEDVKQLMHSLLKRYDEENEVCKSPYCECEKDQCSSGRVDKRAEVTFHTPEAAFEWNRRLYDILYGSDAPAQKGQSAPDFLRRAAELLEQRGKDYDSPEGERSMGKTVEAFNTITGHNLTESEGWLLMQILKDVRQWSVKGRYHQDSAEDGVNYSALKAEALAREGDE